MYAKDNQSSLLEYGFLRENNIITHYSTKLNNCSDMSKLLVVQPNNQTKPIILKRNQTNVDIKDFNVLKTRFELSSGKLHNLYNHHEYLVNGSEFYERINDMFDPMQTITYHINGTANYFNPESDSFSNDPLNGISNIFKNFFSKNIFKLKVFVMIFCMFIFLILVNFIFKNCFYIKQFCSNHSFKKITTKSDHIENDLNFV